MSKNKTLFPYDMNLVVHNLIASLKVKRYTNIEIFQRLGGVLLQGLILVTAIFIFVPFSPSMPGESLDPSWAYGMNQALAQGFAIGQDITFTFGPYASIYTKTFHPVTDGLMLWGSLYLGLSFGILVLLLFNNSRWVLQLGLLLVLSSIMYSVDALLFFYVLMTGFYCYKLAVRSNEFDRTCKYQSLLLVTVLFPIGLLPLIKGSIFILCVAIIAFVCTLLALRKHWKYFLISLFTPIISIVIFWVVSGQSLSGLMSYMISLTPIISGYTEAMMIKGDWHEIAYYLIASILLLWTIYHEDKNKFNIKIFLMLILFVSLFVTFKGGFVRHDGHAIMAGAFLLLTAFLLNTMFNSSRATLVLIVSIFVWMFIDSHYIKTSTESMLRGVITTYSNGLHGIKMRIKNASQLEDEYRETVARLHNKMKFPKLQGTTDIYSYNQSYLISSENIWNPRPTFQSYAAYTPLLVEENMNHISRLNAPENLILKIEPIDGRLPSLEDGASWPIIFSNYEPTSLKDDFLFLKKNGAKRNIFDLSTGNESHYFADIVALPQFDNSIFAKINVSQSVLGKIVSILYKPTQLNITLNLDNGATKSYRLVSSMAKTGMLISPLVENTAEFGFMYDGKLYLKDKKVKSFVIDSDGGHMLWESKYEVQFFDFNVPKNKQINNLFNFQRLIILPDNYHIQNTAACDGGIDFVNGLSPASVAFSASALLSVNGWLAVSAEKGEVADTIMLVLTDASGYRSFVETQPTSRPDVGNAFKNKQLDSSGYSATVDVSKLKGQYTLGLAYKLNNEINICQKFNITGNFKGH